MGTNGITSGDGIRQCIGVGASRARRRSRHQCIAQIPLHLHWRGKQFCGKGDDFAGGDRRRCIVRQCRHLCGGRRSDSHLPVNHRRIHCLVGDLQADGEGAQRQVLHFDADALVRNRCCFRDIRAVNRQLDRRWIYAAAAWVAEGALNRNRPFEDLRVLRGNERVEDRRCGVQRDELCAFHFRGGDATQCHRRNDGDIARVRIGRHGDFRLILAGFDFSECDRLQHVADSGEDAVRARRAGDLNRDAAACFHRSGIS
ncbi:MAG: hypothetical protein BWY76_03179 [bacterium ADurb.Bin429]|nr:MAG: hypothetical protein BWY76_03179 [bacterium ADurb.Bin429]